MWFALLLPVLLAQVTPSPLPSPLPSPAPTVSSNAMPTLTFADALTRLIADAPNKFENDLGAKVVSSVGEGGYHLNFAVNGFIDCRTMPFPSLVLVACASYRGTDATAARGAYDVVKRKLRAFAGRDVPINEETTTASAGENPAIITKATYHPNDKVNVLLLLAQSKTKESVVDLVVTPVVKL